MTDLKTDLTALSAESIEYRIDEIARAEPEHAEYLTEHHLRCAVQDIDQTIYYFDHPELGFFGYSLTQFVHKAISLERVAGRVLPAFFGFRHLGQSDKANALEDRWNGWLKSYEGIMADCPRKMPESASARKMLANTMQVEISHLLNQIVAGLKCEVEAV